MCEHCTQAGVDGDATTVVPMSTRSGFAQTAQMQRFVRGQAGASVRAPAQAPGQVIELPTALRTLGGRRTRMLPDPVDEVACDLYEPDAGRVPITSAVASFGWQPGTQLDVYGDGERLLVRELDDHGVPRGQVKKVLAGGRLGIPAGLAALVGLDRGRAVMVITDRARRELVLVDPARLAALAVRRDDEEEN